MFAKFDPAKTDIPTAVAAASIGIVNMWSGYASGFEQVQKFMNSPDRWVRMGALLGYGLAAHGSKCDGPFDYLLSLLGG